MAITIPTVDEFTESTVMLVIREIAEYICGNNGLVAQINNNDITGFTSSYTNNVLKIDATKGDGSTIPVCNVTIEGGGSSTGNPYPTAVSGTVGVDGNIIFTITMSSGSPITTTINMNYFASADDLSDLQEQVNGLKLISNGNIMSINGTSANIVNSVTGSISGGNLTIGVNGINSSPIAIGAGGSQWEELEYAQFYQAMNSSKIGDEFLIASAYEASSRGIKNCYGICVDETEHIFACVGYFEFNEENDCSPIAYVKPSYVNNGIIVNYYIINGTNMENSSLSITISYSSNGLRYRHTS